MSAAEGLSMGAPDEDSDYTTEGAADCRLRDAIAQLRRYGTPPDDIIDVLEALAEVNDDRMHGRSRGCVEESINDLRGSVERLDPDA